MMLSIKTFGGVAPKVNPRYLPEGGAQIATDVEAFGQSLKPLSGPGASLLTLAKSGTIQSIYRFDQDNPDETEYWFHWAADVDVCRGQIAGDTSEWTFWTGDGAYPKATYNALALAGESAAYPVGSRRLGLPAPSTTVNGTVTQPTAETYAAELTLTASHLAAMTAAYGVKVSVDNGATFTTCALSADGPTAAQAKTALDASASSLVTCAVDGTGLKVTSVNKGATVKLMARWSDATNGAVSAAGGAESLGNLETRIYIYTWIANESGLIMESMPSPPSGEMEVYPGGTVSLSGFGVAPTTDGYNATGVRIYRATAGTYLLVAERTLAQIASGYTDEVAAASLGEACPSIAWDEPPAGLKGLINLPNGMMAGFVGRDVYFCEPYRPYAWPGTYTQVVDAPVVGLGRMDTTLVVLTQGAPYFMQGAGPEYVTVVKSDLEQACVSKRSIVSMGGAVLYASPDGLMMLAPGKSQILTAALFDRADWQTLNPSSIHAYGHDSRYIAFYTKSDGTKGGFVVDLASAQMTLHTLGAGAEVDILGGYTDLRNDQLYLVNANKQVVKWDGGAARTGKWRSKLFALPQITGFSCVQVEAQAWTDAAGNAVAAYPAGQTARVYCDGTLIHTQTLIERAPFRLPAVQGRDWELELDVKGEIFHVAIAQSMSEIAQA